MSDLEHYAGALSRVVGRLRTTTQRLVNAQSEGYLHEWELSQAAHSILVKMRATQPGRVAPWTNVAAVFVYEPPSTVMRGVDDLLRLGLIETSPEGATLTTRGREAVDAYVAIAAKVTDELWGDDSSSCDALLPLLETVTAAASETGGEAFALLHPPYEHDASSSTLAVAVQLAGLHYHRFDAHVSAWRSAGLSALEAHVLTGGALWRVLQNETNARDAAPYSALTRKQRIDLLAGLGSLAG